MSIESCVELESNRFAQVVMIGVFEYLDHFEEAVAQIHRILTPGGHFILAATGKAEYPDNRGMDESEVFERLKPLQVEELYLTYEGKEKIPSSVIVVAEKV